MLTRVTHAVVELDDRIERNRTARLNRDKTRAEIEKLRGDPGRADEPTRVVIEIADEDASRDNGETTLADDSAAGRNPPRK